jgi:hypothetical protein
MEEEPPVKGPVKPSFIGSAAKAAPDITTAATVAKSFIFMVVSPVMDCKRDSVFYGAI